MDIKTLAELANLNYWNLNDGDRNVNINQRIIDYLRIVYPGSFTNGYTIHIEEPYVTVSDTVNDNSKPILQFEIVDVYYGQNDPAVQRMRSSGTEKQIHISGVRSTPEKDIHKKLLMNRLMLPHGFFATYKNCVRIMNNTIQN